MIMLIINCYLEREKYKILKPVVSYSSELEISASLF